MNYETIAPPGGTASSPNMSPSNPLLLHQQDGQRDSAENEAFDSSDILHRPDEMPPRSFTLRSLLVGLVIGALITFSNTYFGLQTGWISTMAMPSALIGFSVFKVFAKYLSYPFTPIENVLIQTVAGAVGTMPLGCGFVGVIPALEFLIRDGEDGPAGDGGAGEGGPLKLNFWKLVLWSLGVCLFGVVFAVPLRKEVIVREKLKFPSGTASALMLRVLHGSGPDEKGAGRVCGRSAEGQQDEEDVQPLLPRRHARLPGERGSAPQQNRPESEDVKKDWRSKMHLLIGAFAGSGIYTLFSYFVPQIRDVPILGTSLAQNWLWTLNPSPAYVGQGIIMGPSTCMHMLLGAALGWGVLSPLAKSRGWAPGPVDSWEDGSKAWIVWISLAIMLADSIVSLGWLVVKPALRFAPSIINKLSNTRIARWIISKSSGLTGHYNYSALHPSEEPDTTGSKTAADDDAPRSQLISMRTVLILLPITLILNVVCMHIVFGDIIPPFLSGLATLLAVLLSVMGVRALGETDLNPVSGISKLTQLLFAIATPASHFSRRSAIITNLLAGAVSESGALQAGDMMQDLKTGHLLGASPKAQFYGQIIGSLVGAVLSTAVYKMYVNVYEVPGPMFQTPTAYVWIFTARLVTGQGLPPMAWEASLLAGAVFALITVFRIIAVSPIANGGRPYGVPAPWRSWIPGGIAVAVGIFNVPSFTLARAIGGLIAWWWSRSYMAKNPPPADPTQRTDYRNGDASSLPDGSKLAAQDTNEDAASSSVVVLASGLILGEGIMSIVNLLLASGGVSHL